MSEPTTHPLAADAAQALQGVTDLIARLDSWKLAWGDLPSIAPHVADAPGMTTGGVIADTQEAAAALTALSEQNVALAAQVAELVRKYDALGRLLEQTEIRAEAAEAKVARLEGALELQEQQRVDAFNRRHLNAPEDPHVYVLCERYGYGAVMDAASRLWARKDSMGAFYIGGCIGINPARAALTEGDTNG